MRTRVWLGLLAALSGVFVAARTTGGAALHAPARTTTDTAPHASAPTDGQWIWTRADAALFPRSQAARPGLVPGVLVASVQARPDGTLELRRGLSPIAAGEAADVALVVRLEDSVHARIAAPDALAHALDPHLASLLAEAAQTGAHVREVQLDYDAPVRRLDEWAKVVGALRRGALRDVPVWVTSIPAHLADPAYGRRFSGVVAGHILQLFDTGLTCSEDQAARIRAGLTRAKLPFRLGVATYERAREGRVTTSHACWRRATQALALAPGFSGVWVFPAGRDTRTALADLEATR